MTKDIINHLDFPEATAKLASIAERPYMIVQKVRDGFSVTLVDPLGARASTLPELPKLAHVSWDAQRESEAFAGLPIKRGASDKACH